MEIYQNQQDAEDFVTIVGVNEERRLLRVRGVKLNGEYTGQTPINIPKNVFDENYKLYAVPRAEAPLTEFQVGDVVILKSGGLQMVVCAVYGPEAPNVHCVWMKPDGEIKGEGVPKVLLIRVDDQQLQPVPMGTL